MTSGLILPGRSAKRLGKTANALLLWRASDLTVTPLTGQAPTFERVGTLNAADYRGTAWQAKNHQPAWTVSGGRAALEMDAESTLFWPILFSPPAIGEEMTMLVELDPVWSRTGGIAGAPGIVTVGGGTGLAGDGKTIWDVFRSSTAGEIGLRAGPGAVPSVMSLPIPATGPVQVLTQLRASGSNHTLYGEVGANSGTTGGWAIASTVWRQMVIELNLSASSAFGTGRYVKLAVARGRRTLTEMLAL